MFSKPVPPPWFKDLVGDVRLPPSSPGSIRRLNQFEEVHASPGYPLPGNQPYAHKCSSYIINAPGYICHLSSLAQQKGIPIIRHLIGNLDEAFHLPELGRVGLVVNATSLGARTLKGVEDPKVFPARGQTVLVRAPGVKVCIMQTEGFMAKHSLDGSTSRVYSVRPLALTWSRLEPVLPPAYIIPRPGPDGHVILGGTYFHSFSTDPDPIESERILKSCYALEPRLSTGDKGGWEGIEVVRHQVGLRPAREGGPRVELNRREGGGVVHAYGFGSAGYVRSSELRGERTAEWVNRFQASLGAAERVAEIVMRYLDGQRGG